MSALTTLFDEQIRVGVSHVVRHDRRGSGERGGQQVKNYERPIAEFGQESTNG